jgi:RNA polymerase sigma factor FliA
MSHAAPSELPPAFSTASPTLFPSLRPLQSETPRALSLRPSLRPALRGATLPPPRVKHIARTDALGSEAQRAKAGRVRRGRVDARANLPACDSTVAGAQVHARYLPLVRRISMRTARSLPKTIALDDILSAGWLGLVEALQRRTPDQDEERFEAFASYRVRGAILDYLRAQDPLTRKLRDSSRQIDDAVRQLSGKLGRLPTESETAQALGMELETYQELLRELSDAGMARLPAPIDFEPADRELSPEAQTSRRQIADMVCAAIDELPERLRLVVAMHYQESRSFREIGTVLSVTESRVCQLHASAMQIIRSRFEESSLRAD